MLGEMDGVGCFCKEFCAMEGYHPSGSCYGSRPVLQAMGEGKSVWMGILFLSNVIGGSVCST